MTNVYPWYLYLNISFDTLRIYRWSIVLYIYLISKNRADFFSFFYLDSYHEYLLFASISFFPSIYIWKVYIRIPLSLYDDDNNYRKISIIFSYLSYYSIFRSSYRNIYERIQVTSRSM